MVKKDSREFFDIVLNADETLNGHRGLSQLERDQMFWAWQEAFKYAQEDTGCTLCDNTCPCVPGNENIVDGKRVCDYCHVKMEPKKAPTIWPQELTPRMVWDLQDKDVVMVRYHTRPSHLLQCVVKIYQDGKISLAIVQTSPKGHEQFLRNRLRCTVMTRAALVATIHDGTFSFGKEGLDE